MPRRCSVTDLPWLTPNGRPQPYVGPDGWLHIPPALAASLDGWASDYRRRLDRERPELVTGPLSAWLGHVAGFARETARTAAQAPAQTPPAPVLDPAQTAAASDADEITVADAAGLLNVTDERVRQMLRSAQLEGRKASRDTWAVSRASVTDEARRRRGNGTRSGTGTGQGTALAG